MTHSFGLSTTARLALLQRLAKRRAHQDEARIGQGKTRGGTEGARPAAPAAASPTCPACATSR